MVTTPGWGNLGGQYSRRWHFFDESGRSLCGNFGWLGTDDQLEGGPDNHPENCKACVRKKLAMPGARVRLRLRKVTGQ